MAAMMLSLLHFFVASLASSVATPPVELTGESLNFLAIGDWGGTADPPYYTVGQGRLASVMGDKAEEIKSQFTLALGDNFYEDGVKDVDDPRFNETFEVSVNSRYCPRVIRKIFFS